MCYADTLVMFNDKNSSTEIPIIKLLDGFVWIEKFTGLSLNVQQWQTDQKWDIKKKVGNIFYTGVTMHTEFQA